jgi:hypothetical protein
MLGIVVWFLFRAKQGSFIASEAGEILRGYSQSAGRDPSLRSG